MKKLVIIIICAVGFLGFTSCRSTAPCGLSSDAKEIQADYLKAEILVAEANNTAE